MLPPCVGIRNGQMHHEILCVSLGIEVLKKKSKRADLKFRDLVIRPVLLEPKIEIELPRERRILRWNERLEVDD